MNMSHNKDHHAKSKGMKSNTGKAKVVHKEVIGLITLNEDPVLSEMRHRGWYLASRCTVHVSNSRDMFVEYHPWTAHEVVLDNNEHVEVAGIGSVVLRFTTGHVLTLSNVFHIPVFRKCLVSLGKLDEMGFGMSFGKGEIVIEKNNEIMGRGFVEDGLFRLSLVEGGADGVQGRMSMSHDGSSTKPKSCGKHDASEDTSHFAECQDMKPDTGIVKVVHKEVIGLITVNEDPALSEMRRRGWYMASRCSVHVCNLRDMFVDYHPWTGHEVVLDNNEHVEVAGVGSVLLQFTTGKAVTLSNVFHIPVMRKCLVSIAKLADMGFGMTFRKEGFVIEKNNEIVGKGFTEDRLFRLSLVEGGSNGVIQG